MRQQSRRVADVIREPQQARSRETMDRILEALEELLREKPFDKITMVELAQKSGSGTSSIYARFKDKQTLILGMHMRVREQALLCLSQLSDPTLSANKSTEEIVRKAVRRAARFYREHAPLIRAALYVDDTNVRERQASVLRSAAQQFNDLMIARAPGRAREIGVAIDASCRLFAAVSYSLITFRDVDMVRMPVDDHEIERQLCICINALIADALNG